MVVIALALLGILGGGVAYAVYNGQRNTLNDTQVLEQPAAEEVSSAK